MTGRWASRNVLSVVVVVAVAAGAILLTASTLAPTTEGLTLQTVGHPGGAAAGNRNEAALFVGVYNQAGSVRGIPGGSFSVAVLASPTGADPIVKASVTEAVGGIYRISLVPERSSHRWSVGKYVVGVTFTSSSGSGVTVGELSIDR